VNLAAALAENGDYEDAVEVYRDVLRDAPGFGEVQQSMALAMLESGDNEGGLATLLDLERRGFDLRSVSANIGVALARRGRPTDLTEALARHERAFKEARDADQEAIVVLNMLSILEKLGRVDDARSLAARAFDRWPAGAKQELAARRDRLRSEETERTVQAVIRVFGKEAAGAMLAASVRSSAQDGRALEHYRPEEARTPTAQDIAALAGLGKDVREGVAAGGEEKGVATATPKERARRARIGLVTALSKEFWAMREMLDNPVAIALRGVGAGKRYVVGTIPSNHGGEHTVLLTLLPEMANNSAAAHAATMLAHFDNITDIIMVGIAGGVPCPSNPEDHVRLGDIVVSGTGGVVQYDLDKETRAVVVIRAPPRPPSAYLLEAVRYLEADALDAPPWKPFIDVHTKRSPTARPDAATDVLVAVEDDLIVVPHPVDPDRVDGEPRYFLGPIASANKLLKNSTKREELRTRFGVRAVEMEGSGIADATWADGAGYLVVRGICDYCDERKNNAWQRYAAVVAAAYTRALIQSIPLAE
jgi:nucleoside phosphorylase